MTDCCLSLDGSFFEIERPYDYEGCYCRKGFLALNVQIVVYHKARVRARDIRPGSANDKAIFNYSHFGKMLPSVFPAVKHIVADPGYAIYGRGMIPCPFFEVIDPDETWYRYLHSRTRITVERAIGMVKKQFRIFTVTLNQKEDRLQGRTETQEVSRIIALWWYYIIF